MSAELLFRRKSQEAYYVCTAGLDRGKDKVKTFLTGGKHDTSIP